MLKKEPTESWLHRNYTNFISDWLLLFVIAFILWVCVAAIISSGISDLKKIDEFKTGIDIQFYWGVEQYEVPDKAQFDHKILGEVEFDSSLDISS